MVASISKVFLIVAFCFGFLIAQNDLILEEEVLSQTADKKEKVNRVDKWFSIDKLQHFSYSCLISLGCQYVLVNKYDNSESEALPISTVLSFSAGLSKELNDSRGRNGFFSVKDMIANCAGLIVESAIINL
tara:strand:+ start:40 stop:432 length:393 start_codon:yes stop_codon:yes gene_type:complete